jgi:hypothetical protein
MEKDGNSLAKAVLRNRVRFHLMAMWRNITPYCGKQNFEE